MPFCRKCGRRLIEYSKKCAECGTSTTAVLINVKKSSSNRLFRASAQAKLTQVTLPNSALPPIKTTPPNNTRVIKVNPVNAPTISVPKPVVRVAPAVPVVPAIIYPPHEILKSNLSIEADIIANPNDYEKQIFGFDLKCPYGHFWAEGKSLPVSNGVAFCPRCGKRLKKPKPKRYRRYHTSY